jgi:hypothetical protein
LTQLINVFQVCRCEHVKGPAILNLSCQVRGAAKSVNYANPGGRRELLSHLGESVGKIRGGGNRDRLFILIRLLAAAG